MNTSRLEAFSDGVLAIIITIMVLEMKVPDHTFYLSGLRPVLPVFLSYILSFIYIGIYWNNHHHLMQATQKVTAGIMWANLHLLFWLSLIPFVTGWMGENNFSSEPLALYGFVLLMSAAAYWILQSVILTADGSESPIGKALGHDYKGKESLLLYAVAVPAAFYNEWIAGGMYVAVALMWLVPDRRIERVIALEPEELAALPDGLEEAKPAPKVKKVITYKPLFIIFLYIIIISLIFIDNPMLAMRIFMSGFFLTFSFFKMLDLEGFVSSYAMYDIIAKRWREWGYFYAFAESYLGIAYAANFRPFGTNILTLALMSIGLIGVLQAVITKKKIRCGCLGTLFNLPMSTVTIVENTLMIVMSGAMLILI